MTCPFLHHTPTELLKEVTQRWVQVGDRAFTLTLPANPDAILDHPITHTAFDADEYLPYWADLWPAAQMLAEALVQADSLPEQVLEIGCGLGLAGLIALSRGCHVTFSDYDAAALTFAARNARQNGFDQFETLQMDWRSPPANLQFPLILAADVLYELRHIDPIVRLIARTLPPLGRCWLVDPDRPHAQAFCRALSEYNLAFDRVKTQVKTSDGREVRGTLYKISLREGQ